MSVHYGITHFPVLHRQFSSPTSRSFLESSPSEDLTQDNKDVLLDRLDDLILRLSKDNSLENSSVTAIHSHGKSVRIPKIFYPLFLGLYFQSSYSGLFYSTS
jgi:hypothetical protein